MERWRTFDGGNAMEVIFTASPAAELAPGDVTTDVVFRCVAKLADERRRDGAFDWSVFEDVAQEGRLVETFLLDSWLQHLRQHERVSNTDRELQDIVRGFHLDGTPRVTHLITPRT